MLVTVDADFNDNDVDMRNLVEESQILDEESLTCDQIGGREDPKSSTRKHVLTVGEDEIDEESLTCDQVAKFARANPRRGNTCLPSTNAAPIDANVELTR